MPFAGYESFDACVTENSDRDDPEAYCAVIKRRTEQQAEMSLPRAHAMRELARTDVERIEGDARDPEGAVRYTDITLLAPGEWTDSKSRTTYYYSPEGIAASAENWADNDLHLNHDGDETILADIGYVDETTAYADSQGRLHADIVFHRRTETSKDAEELMKLTLETEGDQGIGGPSVEITDTEDVYNEERGMFETKSMEFAGVGLVTRPASETVAFSEQLARAASAEPAPEMRTMRRTKGSDPETAGMAEPNEDIRALAARLSRATRALQSDEDLEMLQGLVGSYMDSVEDAADDSVMAMLQWVEENADEDAQTLVAAMIDAYVADHGGSPDEITVNEFAEWADAAMAEDEDEEADEPDAPDESDEDDDEEESEADMAAVDELEARVEALESSLEETESTLSAVEETTDDLRVLGQQIDTLNDQLETVERELNEVRDREDRRALSENGDKPKEEFQVPPSELFPGR